MTPRFTLAAALSLAASFSALADVRVNENFSVNGYAVGSWTTTDPDGGKRSETYLKNGTLFGNTDAVKVGLLGTSGKLSGYGSMLYLPAAGSTNEAGLLDAYVTLDAGNGLKLTGGKFLSYMGYEAFDAPNMAQLTYGYTIFAVPAYHTGAKLDYSTKTFSVGIAAVDSVFGGAKGFFEGDREYSDDIGLEAIMTYTGIDKLTLFAGIASEDTDKAANKLFIFDVWASYALSDQVTLGAEFDLQDDVGKGWLGYVGYKFNNKFSTAFRVSGFEADGGGNDTKWTVAPTFAISPNASIRAEFSLAKGDTYGNYKFYGVQAILKW
ncbi:MAG: outer membrane beta-barrel protein [Opitutaceae bacterium]|nr:outer membrane beta-barrel protein [Opitutaceae bacterium]